MRLRNGYAVEYAETHEGVTLKTYQGETITPKDAADLLHNSGQFCHDEEKRVPRSVWQDPGVVYTDVSDDPVEILRDLYNWATGRRHTDQRNPYSIPEIMRARQLLGDD